MKGWRHDGIQDFVRESIKGGLTFLVAPLVIGAYLFSIPGLSGFPYAILPIASAVLAIFLYAKGRPNSGVFALIAFFLCGEIFTGTPLDIVYSTLYVNAIWMAFGCFVLSVAGTHSGLAERLAEFVVSRAGASYAFAFYRRSRLSALSSKSWNR